MLNLTCSLLLRRKCSLRPFVKIFDNLNFDIYNSFITIFSLRQTGLKTSNLYAGYYYDVVITKKYKKKNNFKCDSEKYVIRVQLYFCFDFSEPVSLETKMLHRKQHVKK